MSTASREWQDTQRPVFVARHMFACAVWRDWWQREQRKQTMGYAIMQLTPRVLLKMIGGAP